MNTQQVMSIGAMLALAGSLGSGVVFAASDRQSSGSGDQSSGFGRAGNQGEGFNEDQTIKGKGRNPESTSRQDAQITLGGARPVVEGQVLNVQGDDYMIKDASGSEVRLRVNKDTNMDCATGSGQGTSMSTGRHADEQGEISPTSHMQERMNQQQSRPSGSQEQKGQEIVQQSIGHGPDSGQQSTTSGERIGDQSGTQSRSALGKDSGGDIARGSGFTFGSKGGCAFKVGDQVRAQVSDLGTVLYIKTVSEKDTRSQQRMSGQMLVPSDETTKSEQQSAQQRAQMMKPGSSSAAGDLQNPEMTTHGQQTAKADTQEKSACEGCKVLRGLVVRSDEKSLWVKEASQKEVRLKLNELTRMGQASNPLGGTFIEGDRIEAMVTPDGYAWSITVLKQQQSLPGADGAPGG